MRAALVLFVLLLAARPLAAQQLTGEALTDYDRLMKEADTFLAAANFESMLWKGEAALSIALNGADQRRAARALQRLNNALYNLGRPMESIVHARHTLGFVEHTGERHFIGQALNNVGANLRDLGDFEGALDYFQRALIEHRAANAPLTDQVLTLRNIAILYTRLNDAVAAERYAREAYAVALKVEDPLFRQAALQAIGVAQRIGGRYDEAARTFQRALAAVAPDTGFRRTMRKEVMTDLVASEHLAGRHARVRTLGQEVLKIDAAYAMSDGSTHGLMGAATLQLGDAEGALAWLQRGLEILAPSSVQSLSYAVVASEVEMWIGRALRRLNRPTEALDAYRSSLAALERLRLVGGTSGVIQARMFATPTGFGSVARVHDYVDLLFDLGRVEDAFNVSERWRARTFLDQLNDQRIGIGRALTEPQQERQRQLGARASALQRQLWEINLTAARRDELQRELADIDEQLELLRIEARRADPKYGDVRYPDILDSARVQAQLPDDTVLVSYVLGEDHSYVWAITRSGLSAALLTRVGILNPRLAAFRRLLSTRPGTLDPNRLTRINQEAAALYRTLIAPIAPSLQGKQRITFVMDGELHGVPMDALRTPRGRWLGEDYDISYAPSASALAAIRRAPADAPRALDLIAVGDPRFTATPADRTARSPIPAAERAVMFTELPYTRVEVDSIAALFPATARRVLLGRAAREEQVKAAPLGRTRYLHFASHAYVNPGRPGRSGVVLTIDAQSSEDGVLEADEVMRLTLDADLVTLSACSTGTGEILGTEGVVGLARAFLHAGAKSVAASLWNVNDSATADLMRAFYTHLHAGAARDEALRRAKLQLAGSDGPWRDPYYWAPFVMVGLPR